MIEFPISPFPDKPKKINLGGFEVNEYIPPRQMKDYIEMLARKVDFVKYENVLVNLKGGIFLFEWISRIKGYKGPSTTVEYHRPEGGFGARVDKSVPKEIIGKKALVFDDIYDSGGVLRAIMSEVSPSSLAVALVTKNGIPNQIQIPNIVLGVKTDNVWLGGCGMDLGVEGEENTFRSYPGIVVKI